MDTEAARVAGRLKTLASLTVYEFACKCRDYSGSRIAVPGKHAAKWHFPQENAAFRDPEKRHMNSGTALDSGQTVTLLANFSAACKAARFTGPPRHAEAVPFENDRAEGVFQQAV